MKIGVVSDTHSGDIPPQLINDFTKVDLIIHAGDFCTLEDVKVFEELTDVKAVRGNMDEKPVCKKFPVKQVITIDGLKIGLYHGEGSAATILETVMAHFEGKKLDAVIFGHSHCPFNQTIGGTLYFNPGSPNDYIRAPYCSYGLMEVSKGKIKARIVKVK